MKQKMFAIAYAAKKRAWTRVAPLPRSGKGRLFQATRQARREGAVHVHGVRPDLRGGAEFLRVCFAARGYGMTESACVISKTHE